MLSPAAYGRPRLDTGPWADGLVGGDDQQGADGVVGEDEFLGPVLGDVGGGDGLEGVLVDLPGALLADAFAAADLGEREAGAAVLDDAGTLLGGVGAAGGH